MKVKKLTTTARLPSRGSASAAGLDLYADGDWEIPPGGVLAASTGIAVMVPSGHVGIVCDRSGLAAKYGVTTLVKWEELKKWMEADQEGTRVLGGVIDEDYRGEIRVILLNSSSSPFKVARGDRVAQLVVLRLGTTPTVGAVEEVATLEETARGTGGLGSTGR